MRSLGLLLLMTLVFGCPPGHKDNSAESESYNELKKEILDAAAKGNEQLASYLEKFFKDSVVNAEILNAPAFILAELDSSIAIERLGFLAKHENVIIRRSAVEALGIRSDGDSLVLLEKLLNNADETERGFILYAVAETGLRNGEKVFDADFARKRGSRPLPLEAMADSRYRNLSKPLTDSVLSEWEHGFCDDPFVDKISAIRRLLDASAVYYIYKDNSAMETKEEIRRIGVAGDPLALKMLMDRATAYSVDRAFDPLAEPVLQSLAISPDVRGLVHITVIRKNARRDGKTELMKAADRAIENSFRFNRRLVLNGEDDFKLQGMKFLLAFATTEYKEKATEVVKELKAAKPKNPLLSDQIKNYFIFVENQSKKPENVTDR